MQARSRATMMLLAACSLLPAGVAHALDPRTTITQYGHTAWRVREGHFSAVPTSLAQTEDGYLWIGTDAGLLRTDGVGFEDWTLRLGSRLPDDRVVALLGASDGSLWIGTSAGLAQWIGGRLIVHATVGRFGALLEDGDGVIWAGHTRALSVLPPLCRIDRAGLRCVGPKDGLGVSFVGALYEDRERRLWVGGDGGVCGWGGGRSACTPIPGLGNQAGVFALGSDTEGALWAGVGGSGVWRRNALRSAEWELSSQIESSAILTDRRGGLWIGTEGGGIIRRAGGAIERYQRTDGLSGDLIADLFEDREGNVWAATSAGLDRFRDVKIAALSSDNGVEDAASAVHAARDGGVWVAGHDFVARAETARTTPVRQKVHGMARSLLEDSRGRLWVGIDGGLARFELKELVPVRTREGAEVGVVIQMVEGRDGQIYVATTDPDRALLRVKDGEVVESFARERFVGEPIGAMLAEPGGPLWLAFRTGLVACRDQELDACSPLMPLSEGSLARSLVAEPGRLWVGTNRGLLLLHHGDRSPPALLDRRNGLPCDDLEVIIRDDAGAMWLKLACGLARIDEKELERWSAEPGSQVDVRVLDALDGARSGIAPFTPRAAKSADGQLWFAADRGGLQVIDPARLDADVVPPRVSVVGVVANRTVFGPADGLRLPAHTTDVELRYTALNLSVPEKARFRYRLSGVDDDWRKVGPRREAFYTNLGPGDFRFEVVAGESGGAWSAAPVSFTFSIAPAFHQTSAFFGLCMAVLAALAGLIVRWRFRSAQAALKLRFEARIAERTRIARELHDTLLQGFVSSSMQLHATLAEIPPTAPFRERLQRVQQMMGQVIEEGRLALRGLRSREADPDGLERALSRVAGELAGEHPVRPNILVQGTTRSLRPAVHDEVYSIAREALVNAFKHANAETLKVEINYGPRALSIVVRDDGIGVGADVLRAGREGHWGLEGMRERAKRIKAELEVRSSGASGTEVELTVPGRVAFEDHRTLLSAWWRALRRGGS